LNERRARIGFWLVLAAGALLLSLGAGSLPLLDPDESRFARTSVEMVRSGDLVVPHFEGQPRLVKPPLLHWIQSTLFRLFGTSERVARLPSAVATLLSLLIVGWVALRRFGHEGALWAAAILGTMPLVVAVGKLGTLDALLAVHVLAVIALDIAEPKETGSHLGLAVGFLLGLAFLTKGPVGVVVPLLVMLAGRTASGREILPRRASAIEAVAGWCIVVLPWTLAFIRRLGFDQSLSIVRGEALERFFVGSDHIEPPWFFLGVLGVGIFPWIAPLVVALGRMVVQRSNPASRTALYAGAGLVAGLFFFSLSKSKLANYILPLPPLAAILLTWELGQELQSPRERITAPILITMSLGAAGLGLILASGLGLDPRAAAFAPTGAVIYGLGAVAGFVGLILRRPRWVWGGAAAASALFLAAAFLLLVPQIARTRTSAYLIDEVPALREASRPVVTVDMKVPSLTHYLDRVPEEVDLRDFDQRLALDDAPLFVFDEDDLSGVAPETAAGLDEVGRQGKYVVLEKVPDPADSPQLDGAGR